MEQGHYDVSVAVAEQKLLPTLRDANPEAVFLADGFSCRTQASQLKVRTGSILPSCCATAETPPHGRVPRRVCALNSDVPTACSGA